MFTFGQVEEKKIHKLLWLFMTQSQSVTFCVWIAVAQRHLRSSSLVMMRETGITWQKYIGESVICQSRGSYSDERLVITLRQ